MGRFTGMSILHVRPPGGGELEIFVAERPGERLLGLAGMRALPAASGLLIPNCRSIHTFGMRFSLDVVFVAVTGRFLEVVDLRVVVPPRRVVRSSRVAGRRSALGVLELRAGDAERLALAAPPAHVVNPAERWALPERAVWSASVVIAQEG